MQPCRQVLNIYIFRKASASLVVPSGLAGGSVEQTVAATEEEQPSDPSRRSRRLLPAGVLHFDVYSCTCIYKAVITCMCFYNKHDLRCVIEYA